MYTFIEEAVIELKSRWKDDSLKNEVLKFLKIIPSLFADAPRAVLARQLITPNFETLRFWELANGTGVSPLGMSFVRDKFVTSNSAKVRLGKMYFFHGVGRNGGEKRSAIRVIDFEKADGSGLDEIKTLAGEGLVEFHLRLFKNKCFIVAGDFNQLMTVYHSDLDGLSAVNPTFLKQAKTKLLESL